MECGARRLEARTLLIEQRMGRALRGGEVRIYGVDLQRAAPHEIGQRLAEIVVAKAEAVHPGIDLDVHAELAVARGGSRRETARGAG